MPACMQYPKWDLAMLLQKFTRGNLWFQKACTCSIYLSYPKFYCRLIALTHCLAISIFFVILLSNILSQWLFAIPTLPIRIICCISIIIPLMHNLTLTNIWMHSNECRILRKWRLGTGNCHYHYKAEIMQPLHSQRLNSYWILRV